MGTNFYRIPTEKELEQRKNRLQTRIRQMDLKPSSVNRGFNIGGGSDEWTNRSPWDEFTEDIQIHLGKRSMGWKFCWNFHDNKHYHNKESLETFVRSGRVIDEYGEEISPDEFLEMAYNWCVDGWDNQKYDEENPSHRISWIDKSKYYDTYIDDLRISSSKDFS
jgi:hypothetical protein